MAMTVHARSATGRQPFLQTKVRLPESPRAAGTAEEQQQHDINADQARGIDMAKPNSSSPSASASPLGAYAHPAADSSAQARACTSLSTVPTGWPFSSAVTRILRSRWGRSICAGPLPGA